MNRARTSQGGRPKSVEQDGAKPHAPHLGRAAPSAYTMMSFEEHRPGTAKGYQICRVAHIKDQPSEKCRDPDSQTSEQGRRTLYPGVRDEGGSQGKAYIQYGRQTTCQNSQEHSHE